MSLSYIIERGIPAPLGVVAGSRATVPSDNATLPSILRSLRVGDSILVPDQPYAKVMSSVSSVGRTLNRVFTTRRIDADATRVWRVG